ncbi:hypothetical protein JCM5353_008094 [Sporobolomyces roseus]
MPTGRTAWKHVPQYHYALLLISPVSSRTEALPIDEPTFLQILQKRLSEWFGTAGGVNSNEVEIVEMQEPPSGMSREGESDTGAREVILRFPRSITPQLLTALPLLTASTYRIRLLDDSHDLSRFAGFAGRGKSGFNDWKTRILVNPQTT